MFKTKRIFALLMATVISYANVASASDDVSTAIAPIVNQLNSAGMEFYRSTGEKISAEEALKSGDIYVKAPKSKVFMRTISEELDTGKVRITVGAYNTLVGERKILGTQELIIDSSLAPAAVRVKIDQAAKDLDKQIDANSGLIGENYMVGVRAALGLVLVRDAFISYSAMNSLRLMVSTKANLIATATMVGIVFGGGYLNSWLGEQFR